MRAIISAMTQDADTGSQRKANTSADLRALASKSMSLAASVIKILCTIFAAILVIHIVLTVASANPQNGITTFFADAANSLTLGIGDLFLPASESLKVILNYGLAAVVWLVIGAVVARILNALAP
ncbi:hypothetical protein GCM10023201_54670 [Actinomycetospora corticicola]